MPRWTIRPPTGFCVSLDGEQLAAAPRFADRALVADLPAAFRVERRAVEHDLGRAVPGQLVELHAVADDRHDATLGGRRLVAEELGVAGATLDGAVQRSQLGVPGQIGLLARTASLALLREGVLRTRRRSTANAVLRGELDGQVDREAVGVVEPEGDVAVEDGGIGRQVLRPAPDDALGRRARRTPRGSPRPAASSQRRACARTGPPRAAIAARIARASRPGAGTHRP